MSWEAVIGLEVHVQLRTRTKAFCRCPNRFGAPPNTLVCPVCLGYPGALPMPNREAQALAVRLALAVGAEVAASSRFARKSYFYPDLPKGYQITQYDRPLARGGALPLAHHDRAVGLERLHLEEDAGKLLHGAPGEDSRVDFNRAGVPLVELVSRPELGSPAEAHDFLQSLHQLLLYTGTSDGSMEEGSLRCDANVSLRPAGTTALGTKVEVKNLNSFRFVARALEHEIARQEALLAAGEAVAAETRSFDAARGVTRPARSKEGADDYRYFPEPDLPPLDVGAAALAAAHAALPALPWERRRRLAERGLTAEEARALTASPELADYTEAAMAAHPAAAVEVARWVKNEVLRLLKQDERAALDALAPERLARLVALVGDGSLSAAAGKTVLEAMAGDPRDPADLAAALGLVQVRDRDRLAAWVEEALAAHPEEVAQYRGGRHQLLGFFVGAVMRASEGRAAPKEVRRLLAAALTDQAEPALAAGERAAR